MEKCTWSSYPLKSLSSYKIEMTLCFEAKLQTHAESQPTPPIHKVGRPQSFSRIQLFSFVESCLPK